MFFTVVILVLMVGAIPVAPIVVDLVKGAAEDGSEADPREAPALSYGYVDSAGILADLPLEGAPQRYADKDEGLIAVRNGEIDTLFVLPNDYIASGRIEDYWTTRERGPVWADNSDAERSFRAFLKRWADLGAGAPGQGGARLRHRLHGGVRRSCGGGRRLKRVGQRLCPGTGRAWRLRRCFAALLDICGHDRRRTTIMRKRFRGEGDADDRGADYLRLPYVDPQRQAAGGRPGGPGPHDGMGSSPVPSRRRLSSTGFRAPASWPFRARRW